MHPRDFRIKPDSKVDLDAIDPADTRGIGDEDKARELLSENVRELDRLTTLLWAEHRRGLLVVLQGIDASGKDGTIRHVLTGINPQCCRVESFKRPSDEELDHDFLWRVHAKVPRRGQVAVFNRSHYEDVVVVRVRELVPKSVWRLRYAHINEFERCLADEGTVILKFFLHISREEQARRLNERLRDPSKNWKFEAGDLAERERWGEYRKAYEAVLERCSTEHAPWHVVPADRKWFRNAVVSSTIVDTLKKLDMKFPAPTFDPRTVVVK